jgi:hypothetical protein
LSANHRVFLAFGSSPAGIAQPDWRATWAKPRGTARFLSDFYI